MTKTTRIIIIVLGSLLPVTALGEVVTVRVATFNIENFNSTSGPQFDAARDILLRVEADVVCVQEMGDATAFMTLATAAGYPDYRIIAYATGDIDTGTDWAGIMSKYPFVTPGTGTKTAAALSGDPSALDITRNFIVAVVNVPNADRHLTITGNHWKAGGTDADEFRRSIESIRAMQVVENLDSPMDAYVIVGDMNDDYFDGQDTPTQFFALPGGLPVSFNLGNDITFPVNNGVFKALIAGSGSSELTVIHTRQKDGSDSTRWASGRWLDYIWRSDAIAVDGSEIYDSRDEGLPGGLPKSGSPLPSGTSLDASDHLLVFADLSFEGSSTLTGACCDTNGICQENTDQADCLAADGYFYGAGTDCTGPLNPPCVSTGACCLPAGVCTNDTDPGDCATSSGIYYGNGSACDDPLDPPCESPGACCKPGGVCVDDVGTQGCLALGGLFYGVGTDCAGPLDPPCDPIPVTVIINEVLATHDGDDTAEFLELFGTPFGTLEGLTVLAIEGQGASKGRIDDLIDLDGYQLNYRGYFVMGDELVSPDLVVGTINIFEDGTQTFVLVEDIDPGLVVGSFVDTDHDGNADVIPGTILDSVGLAGPDYPASDAIYYGAPAVGPQAGAFPAGGARIPNGTDTDTAGDWVYLSMELGGADGDHPVTPGSANAGDGDFDDNAIVDLLDFQVFQYCFTGPANGPPDSGCDAGDFDADDDIDADDFALFNGLFAGP
ncbi:MAG TPA: endonuclease/exonuclease/phosphatase family protein [Phycisphaerae bacterium]|nr:endonuclease/exonuclease/phosphatase family protein [Phycisphaerae bacterium]